MNPIVEYTLILVLLKMIWLFLSGLNITLSHKQKTILAALHFKTKQSKIYILIQTRFSQNSVCRANLTRKCPQQSLYQVWDKNSRNWNNGSHLKFSLKRFLLITGHCTTELLLFIYCTGKLSVHSSEMLSRISKLINWV